MAMALIKYRALWWRVTFLTFDGRHADRVYRCRFAIEAIRLAMKRSDFVELVSVDETTAPLRSQPLRTFPDQF